jgi:hypothetical protein
VRLDIILDLGLNLKFEIDVIGCEKSDILEGTHSPD